MTVDELRKQLQFYPGSTEVVLKDITGREDRFLVRLEDGVSHEFVVRDKGTWFVRRSLQETPTVVLVPKGA